MKRTFNVGLSASQFDEVIKELQDYKDRILPMRIEEFTNRLAERGIQIAKAQIGNVGVVEDGGKLSSLVQFTKEVTMESENECKAILVMSDKMPMSVTWLYRGKPKTEIISPTLMHEFGSGKHAIDGHRGTFPRSDGEPSKGLENVWRYQSLDGKWHSTSGITPTQPLYHAINDLYNEVIAIAREVF